MAVKRLPPTPDNYERTYRLIAAQNAVELAPSLAEAVAAMVKQLPRESAELSKVAPQLERALAERQWDEVAKLLQGMIAPADAGGPKGWPDVIRDLLKQWDSRQSGLSTARKREGLERLLINFGTDASLPVKLRALAKSWSEYPPPQTVGALSDEAAAQDAAAARGGADSGSPVGILVSQMQDALALALEYGLVPRLIGFPDLQDAANRLVVGARSAQTADDWRDLAADLKKLVREAELQGVNEARLQEDLLRLLRLLVDNISELIVDDQWIRGQIAAVQTIISSELDQQMIVNAEKGLKEVIYKQGSLKHSLNEAKQTFKQMVAAFIDRLGQMATSTGDYHDKIGVYAQKISATDDIVQLNILLEGLMQDTRVMQLDIARSRDALEEERRVVEGAEARVRALEKELETISEQVREDQLTGTLNRRGLDDAFIREVARAGRGGLPLTVALLDIDNFKRLNDTLGHQAGDQALKHLANVVKETLRPTDIVARFGGEEFVILLPNTGVGEAVNAITRSQRELTRRFFLHNNERLLITFSAGVALYRPGEPQADVVMRADQAMYAAKKAGKNRVFAEAPPA